MSRKTSQNQDDEEDKPAVNIYLRIDIALDDYDELVKFDDGRAKTQKGALSVIKTAAVQYCQNLRPECVVKKLGKKQSINARTAAATQSRKCVCSFYDKLAQYREKNQLTTSDIREHWKKNRQGSLATLRD